MTSSASIFEGLSAFPITPASSEGRVDAEAFAGVLKPLRDADIASIGLLGSTGTYAYLSRAERRRACEIAHACVGGARPTFAGVGAMRTDEAIALARDAEAAGMDGLLLAPVSYTPLTQDEAFEHFRAVAGATRLPLCIYNNPGTTHFTFGVDLLKRIGSLQNVHAVKMPLPADGDFAGEIARLREALPEGFVIGYSGDWGCSAALLAGADAWFSAVAGVLPGAAVTLARASRAGDAEEVAALERRFAPLWALFREFGSLRVVHAIARLQGLSETPLPRPLLALPEAQWPRLEAALSALDAEDA